jgi:hypothetical protein
VAKFNQDVPQFGSAKPANAGGSHDCAECEVMLTDALDGTLSLKDQAKFDQHLAGCSSCTQMLAEAKRGAAWLEMLRTPRPEPPAALLERILAQTNGQTSLAPTVAAARTLSILPASAHALEAPSVSAATQTATILPFRSRVASVLQGRGLGKGLGHSMLQPRLAMTAAMAFFSVGLTLNLTGVHLNEFRAADLKPANLRRTFYQANAHVVRYYDNLRVVYELESRVRDLQRSNDNDAPSTPEATDKNTAPEPKPSKSDKKTLPGDAQPEQKPRPRPNSGTSRRQGDAGPISLLASYRAVVPASPLGLSASTSPSTTSFASTLQEGDLV